LFARIASLGSQFPPATDHMRLYASDLGGDAVSSVKATGAAPAIGLNVEVRLGDIVRSMIEASPAAMVMFDDGGKIMLANTEAEWMFGYPHDQLIGQMIDVLVPTEKRAEHARRRKHFAASPEARWGMGRELTGLRMDGTEFPVEVDLNPIQCGQRSVVLSVIVDIGEHQRSERLKDNFVATVSHELRTPLTSIAGALALLVRDPDGTLPASVARLLGIAHANCQRLVRLVNGILDLDKIESGKVVFILKTIPIRPLVERAIEAVREYADSCRMRIRLDAPATAGVIRTDPNWLIQILTNLLSNAIKFSPPDGDVAVAIEESGGTIRISVRDHGPGIPLDFKHRIFEKFAQADATDARQSGGAGLGLSTVKQLVARLGGKVGFDDAPSGGTIFHVELPGWEQELDAPPDLRAAPKAIVASVNTSLAHCHE
jgi:PAS domain S-box-containing protein